ncbi:MAG TPA: hypothetical protein VFK14_10945 [Solirubrobacterales bacterium]|nr:hypothetical protein [Solirubrobacterales bacterium]
MAERGARARDRNDREILGIGAVGHALTLLCECGHESCGDVMVVTPAEYDDARARRLRLVSRAHERFAEGAVAGRTERFALVADE